MNKPNIEEFLYRNKLKQVELAKYLNIAEASVSKYLSGGGISAKNLNKIINNPNGWDVSMLLDETPSITTQVSGSGQANVNVGHHISTGNKDSVEKFSIKIATLTEQVKLRDQKIEELEEQLREEKGRSAQYWEMIQKLMK